MLPLRPALLVLGLAAASLAACTSDASGPSVEDAGRALVWSDEFDGPAGALPDPAHWVFETYGDGSGNNELQCYTEVPGNIATDGEGHLVITAIKQPGHQCVDGRTNDYTSARITTQGLHTFEYGRLEVRAQVPTGVGTWPAFWALGDDHDTVGWPRSGEIDVMEHVGRAPTEAIGAVHAAAHDGSHFYLSERHDVGTQLGAGFHTYAVDWDEDSITWSVDDEEFQTITREEVEEQGPWVFDHPFYLLLNLAIGGNLGGEVPATTPFPQSYVVDHVRIYQ